MQHVIHDVQSKMNTGGWYCRNAGVSRHTPENTHWNLYKLLLLGSASPQSVIVHTIYL